MITLDTLLPSVDFYLANSVRAELYLSPATYDALVIIMLRCILPYPASTTWA